MSDSIRILSLYFYPDIASTGQLLTELGGSLRSLNLKVKVITAFPSYDTSIKAKKNEKYNGMYIKRFTIPKVDKNKKYSKIFIAITFFVKSLFHILFSKDKTPLLIVSNPPFLPLIGFFGKKIRRVKYISLIHDIHPEVAEIVGFTKKGNWINSIWKKARNKFLRESDNVIVLSNGMKKKLINISNVDENKVQVITNWADETLFSNISPKENNNLLKKFNLQNKFVILYSGNLGWAYDLELLLESALLLKNNSEIVFLIVGDGMKKNKLIKFKNKHNLENVFFKSYQEKSSLVDLLALADISIVTYEEKLEGLLMPSKLYTSLAVGKPIIGLCRKESEVGEIIENNNCGFCVNNDPEELRDKITKLYNDSELMKMMSENSRKVFLDEYTLQKSAKKYFYIIEDLNK